MADLVKILLVEDDDKMREMLVGLLQDEGYDVTGAGSGEEAIAAAEEQQYDLVVADVKLGRIDGLDALSAIKTRQPELESMVITGYSTEADSIRAIRLGVGSYLKKPFNIDDFLRAVAERVARVEELRALRHREQAVLQTAVWALESLTEQHSAAAPEIVSSARLGEEVAQSMGLSDDLALAIRLAALLAFLQRQGALHERDFVYAAMPPEAVSLAKSASEPALSNEALQLQLTRLVQDASTQNGLSAARGSLAEAFRQARDGRLEQPERSDSRRGLLSLALALESKGDLVAANEALERLESGGSARLSVLALLGRARLKWMVGRPEEAYQLALEAGRKAQQAESFLEAGTLLLRMGKSEAAELLQEAAGRCQPGEQHFAALAHLGLVALGQAGHQEVPTALRTLMQTRHLEFFLDSAGWLMEALLRLPPETAIEERTRALRRLVRERPRVVERLLRDGLPEGPTLACLRLISSVGKSGHESALEWSAAKGMSDQVRGLAQEILSASSQALMPPILRLYLMGPFEVWIGEHRLERKDWSSQKARYLLARVAAAGGRPVPQDLLIEEFWPQLGETAARNLYQTLTIVRRVLQPPNWSGRLKHIERGSGGLHLTQNLPIWIDLSELQHSKDEAERLESSGNVLEAVGHLESIARLYRGPFLEGCYMDWAVERRRALQSQLLESLLRLMTHRGARGEFSQALEAADVALRVDPCCQPAHQGKMEALVGLNRPEEAVRQFHLCEKVLAEELSVEPNTDLLRTLQIAKLQS